MPRPGRSAPFLLLALSSFAFPPSPAAAQALRDQISELFIFRAGEEVLFLGGSGNPNNPANIQAHGGHFIPAAVEGNATIIAFLTNSISSSLGNVPLAAASGSSTFRFEGGAPVRTSTSAGPVLAERAQTLGRGRVLVGLSRTGVRFRTLRGVDLDRLRLVFTHANVDFPNCDAIFQGDCSLLGVPDFENETIELQLDLEAGLSVSTFLLAYGITDRVDIGVALPVVRAEVRGTSQAQIVPFGTGPAPHFFDGTPESPVLTATRFVDDHATGIGDVTVRLKANLRDGDPVSLGLLAEGRLPTGREEDLLGGGGVDLRGLAVLSARFGAFSPHANVGYLYRGKFRDSDAFLATVGFDHLLAPWATLAADFLSAFEVGTNRLLVSEDVLVDAPYRRVIRTTEIPNERDDLLNASIGIKVSTPRGLIGIANAAWPLNRGGLRPDVLWTLGVEYTF
jgi:hypothetical protein